MSLINTIYYLARNEFKKELEYKENLYFGILIEVIYLAITTFSIFVLYQFTDTIVGFTFKEMILFPLITSISIEILFMIMFKLDFDINSGKLQIYLVRPVSEFVFLFTLNFSNLGGIIINTILVVLIIIYYTLSVSLLSLSLAMFVYIISFPTMYLIFMIIQTITFYFGKNSFDNTYRSIMFSFDRFPVTILTKWFFIIFLIVTPAGYLHWYLTIAILLNKLSYSYILLMIFTILILDVTLFTIFRSLYKKGLRKFEAYGG